MSLFEPHRPAVVGHRGAPLLAPENTLEAFRRAAADGAHWVELDARRTADDHVAVIHDPHHGADRPVVASGADDLVRAGIPTLRAVLEGAPDGLGLDVELKNLPGEPDYDESQRLAVLVAETLRPWMGRRPLLASSFNPLALQVLREQLPNLPLGLLTAPAFSLDSAADLAREFRCDGVFPHVTAPDLTAEVVAGVHARGLSIMVWTVDEPSEARRLAAAGVDALCTNDPAGLIGALRG